MSKFKTILNKKLKLNNISKNKFAKMIGVTSVYVGQLTRGERDPSKKLQIKIADIFYEQEKEKNNSKNVVFVSTSDIIVRMLENKSLAKNLFWNISIINSFYWYLAYITKWY